MQNEMSLIDRKESFSLLNTKIKLSQQNYQEPFWDGGLQAHQSMNVQWGQGIIQPLREHGQRK